MGCKLNILKVSLKYIKVKGSVFVWKVCKINS